ncbi:MAG: transketolase [Phycisphaerales bacterium JB060]
MSFEAAVHAQAIDLCKMSLEMTEAAGSGHPTTAMSLSHITTVLLFHTMRWSPEYPDYPTSDRLVLSAGHAVPVVYAAACKLGVMVGRDPENRRPLTLEDASTLRQQGSELDGHPNPMEGFPFFDAATGSLGQGLSVACGLAEADRLDGRDRVVYCIIGDGESREGQIAEALDYVAERKLRKVVPIFNCNGYGQAGRVSDQQGPERLAKKLEAYGLEVITIDGHDPAQIRNAFERAHGVADDNDLNSDTRPVAIVAKTVKGWGAPSMQGNGWHGKPAKSQTLERAKAELDERRGELTSALSSADSFAIQPPPEPAAAPQGEGEVPSMDQAMKQMDMESLRQTASLATRRAYGLALRAMGKPMPQVVVLDADVGNSTFAETFAKDSSLAPRFFECKIAEQHMISMAAGLSAAGKIPFCSSFAKFLTRAYDQIEMAINSGANIKIVGSHSGVTLAADGPSQMGLPDVSWFRSFTTMKDHRGNPGCYVLQPSDAYSAYALSQVMAEYEGACYMRTQRPDVEFLYSADDVFNLGGFEVLNEGRDIVICASGYMVHEANKAVELLDKAAIQATLVDMYSLPFDEDKLLDIIGANGGFVISMEDNYGGALGSAIAEAIATSGDGFTLKQMHVTHIPSSARTADELLKQCKLTAEDLVDAVKDVLQVV